MNRTGSDLLDHRPHCVNDQLGFCVGQSVPTFLADNVFGSGDASDQFAMLRQPHLSFFGFLPRSS